MKKQILLSILSLVSIAAFAQSNIHFGVKAGLSSAGIRGDAANNLKDLLDFTNGRITTANRTGFFAGGYATIPLSAQISVEPGLYYSQKGYALQGELGIKGVEFLGANAKATLQSDYIDIPVLLKADLGGFQVFAGPQFSYLSSAKLKTNASILGINLLNRTIDAKSQFNDWDMGVTAGVGYQFKGGFNVSASYDYGLSHIDKNQNVNAYNNAFKVGLGISF